MKTQKIQLFSVYTVYPRFGEQLIAQFGLLQDATRFAEAEAKLFHQEVRVKNPQAKVIAVFGD